MREPVRETGIGIAEGLRELHPVEAGGCSVRGLSRIGKIPYVSRSDAGVATVLKLVLQRRTTQSLYAAISQAAVIAAFAVNAVRPPRSVRGPVRVTLDEIMIVRSEV